MTRRAATAIAAAAFVLVLSCSFEPPAVEAIEERLARAETMEKQGDLDGSLALLEEAADGARARGEPILTARVLNRLSAVRLRRGENESVRAVSEEALAEARRAGDGASESDAIFNQGSLQYASGRMRDALRSFESSSEAASRAGDEKLQARADIYVGYAAVMLEERERAEDALGRAKALARQMGDAQLESEATRVLGQLHSRMGENQRALEYFEEARKLLSASNDPAAEATLLNSIGQLYYDMGEIEAALEHYRRALELNRSHPFRRREAATLLEVGRCNLELGRRDEARRHLEEALAIYREIRNPMVEADVLTVMGRLESASGNTEAALRSLDEALALKISVGDVLGRAFVLDEVGEVHRRGGNYEKALEGFHEAADRSREAHDPFFESLALYHIAIAQRDAGRLEDARRAVEDSLGLSERVRARVASHALRTSYFSAVHDRYSFYVDLLMRLHRERPGEGFDALAFQAAERARARTLRESLQEAAAGIRVGVEPDLLAKERELRLRLNELAVEEELLSKDSERGRVRREIDALSEEYDRLQSTIRSKSPRYASLIEPGAAALPEVQSFLDEHTRFAAYHLGRERSFVWTADRDGYAVHEIEGAESIESLAREAYANLKSPGAFESPALDRLSRILLDPLGDFDETRLVVVADGALGHLPFAALADPRTAGSRLVDAVEVVRLPSASLLSQLRAQRAGRRFLRTAAIAADPAYGDAFRRLPESRREAERIAALSKPGEIEVVSGVSARREWVERTDFSRFRYLHFAAHAVIDDERPELSGIVLSLVDAKGAPSDGFLRLHDVYNLALPVDLVVLSACETGLGKEVEGEGLIGLVRGFMYAGAPAVIASSWKVDDAATAELMTELYRGLFSGKPPSAALREAQLHVARIPRFRSPYYWAAFELQGDWR